MKSFRPPSVVVAGGLVALGLVLSPSASSAAGSLMTLVDSDSTSQAQVDGVPGTGKLRVGDGLGAMTVDGTVTARTSQPAVPWAVTLQSSETLRPSRSLPTVISSLTVTNNGTGPGMLHLYRYYNYSNGSGGSALLTTVHVPAKTTTHLPFPTGWRISTSAGSTFYIYAAMSTTGGSMYTVATGYDA